MTFKSCIIEIGDNPALSEAVQQMLFGLGYAWQSGKSGLFRMFYPYLQTYDHGALLQRVDAHESLPRFSAATQLGELVAFLAAPEAPKLPYGAVVHDDGSITITGDFHGIHFDADQWDEITAAKAARVKKESPKSPRIVGCRDVTISEGAIGKGTVTLDFGTPRKGFPIYPSELDALHAASLAARKGAE